MPKRKPKCSCPIGIIKGGCPFSYDNGWHLRRDAILIESDLKPAVLGSIEKVTPEQFRRASEHFHNETLEED